ncbi:MAG: hypothetical protein WAM39_11340 [Bryobacteraceae bacterium]
MKWKWPILAVLAARLTLAAEAACPVTIEKVRRDTGVGDRNTYCFSLEVVNHSAKQISEVNLSAVAIDSKPWEHPLHYDYVVAQVGPGETKAAYFSTHRLLGTDYHGVKVWVQSIGFQDRTTWKDNGTRACGSEDVKKK